MLALLAITVLAPIEMKLPIGAQSPDSVNVGGAVHVVYEESQNGWYTRYGGQDRVRINSALGSVQAGGERGPKIAVSGDRVYAAWQSDYRLGPKAWFSRSIDGGQTFEAQRNLIDGKTPGIDEVTVASAGDLVAVFWLDGRTGPDPESPVTSGIWYTLSRDGGRTFGTNQQLFTADKTRACSCCSFDVKMSSDETATIAYRSGIRNVREVYLLTGNVGTNTWSSKKVSTTNWVLAACPMDGPRRVDGATAYEIDGKVYVKEDSSLEPTLLGRGKYPSVLETPANVFAIWQDGGNLSWRWLKGGQSGKLPTGLSRAALAADPDGQPLIVH
ncbi:MAG: hypothetical protein ACHQ50_17245 [Fimbriimonadales bacterium]